MSAVVSASEGFDVDELFDDAGELRLEELVGGGWVGYERDVDGTYYWHNDAAFGAYWRRLRVGERAVREAVQEAVDEMPAEQRALACLAYLRDASELVVVGP